MDAVRGQVIWWGYLIWRPGSNGAWLVLTLLAVTQFGADAHLKRTLGRVAGTLAGVVIAAIVASVSGSEAVLVAIGLVLLVITAVIMLGPHSYVLYSVFITPRSCCSPRPASLTCPPPMRSGSGSP